VTSGSGSVAETPQPGKSALNRLLPWAIWLLTVVIAVATLVLFPPVATPRRDVPAYLAYFLSVAWSIGIATVGALIVSSRPANRIGWLLIMLGVLMSGTLFASGYSQAPLPAAELLDLLSDIGFVLWIALFSLLILLFPDGRPLSPRWRPVVWFAGLWPPILGLIGLIFARDELLSDQPSELSLVVVVVLTVLTAIAACVSALLRFARARGPERAQLKWFAYAATIGFTGAFVGEAIGPWGDVLVGLFLYAPVAGIGVAILRHRLYDIDVLINRTFVYGALTAILAGVYAASIRLFQAIFVALTGQESDAAYVITTLILATTFTPIKLRLEEIAKRRFREPDEAVSADADASPATLDALRAELREQAQRLERLEREVRG
jgi:hypothetical protein